MIPIVVVAGPTASGKTSLSIELAKALNGEIVSADSMQIYKYMNIGTAKPDEEEKAGIPHHLMDFADPQENFSAADYCSMAKVCIAEIHSRGKLPIITGGTGLYIDSLVSGVDFEDSDSDPKIREELAQIAQRDGVEAVYAILREIDPETAEKYHPNNLRRVIRAIEFYRVTGKTISAHAKEEKNSPYKCVYFCIDWDREVLYERINRRVDIMMESGLEAEARKMYEMLGNTECTAMQGIGYKEFFGYFEGEKTLEQVVEEIKMNSRRYAKRQLTWFRRNKDIYWLRPDENMLKNALGIIKNVYKK